MKKLYINYLKPWRIIIVFIVLLSSFLPSCKEEEEIVDDRSFTCVFPRTQVSVESEIGSVVQTDKGPYILSDLKLNWIGEEYINLAFRPLESDFEIDPFDLANNIGNKLKFSGTLSLERRDSLTIEGEHLHVVMCYIRDYDLQFTGGGNAVTSSD